VSPLCRKCGKLLDPVLVAQGLEYHPTCEPVDPNEQLGQALLADLTDVIKWTDSNSARSLQTTIGPSELGSLCDRRIAYRLAGTPEANWWSDPLPAIVGTAVHTWLEKAINSFQQVHFMDRWLTEITVQPDPVVKGHVDLYDKELGAIIDWKAQPDDELVLTPTGWVRMDDLSPGDHVIGSNGGGTRVVGVYPQGEKPVYRVTTSDRGSCEATEDHLWLIGNRQRSRAGGHRPQKIMTTGQIIKELSKERGAWCILPELLPVEFGTGADLPMEPYALGLLLGDGSMSQGSVTFTNSDGLEKFLPFDCRPVKHGEAVRSPSFVVLGAVPVIRELGLYGKLSIDKHIPKDYLFASVADRISLLQGLMDTDGCTQKGNAAFCTSSDQLAADFTSLVQSLGGKAFGHRDKKLRKGATALAHLILVKLPDGICPFRADITNKKGRWRKGRDTHERFIRSIEFSRVTTTRCIKVEAEDQLYVTRNFILTHNTVSPTKLKAWKSAGPPEHYKDQVNLYGRGALNAGLIVNKVILVAVPRSGWLKDMQIWVDDYRPERAQACLDRMYSIANMMIKAGDDLSFEEINSAPSGECAFCPWYRGGNKKADLSGCSGNVEANKAKYGKGLVKDA
jgi:hypothetical protein